MADLVTLYVPKSSLSTSLEESEKNGKKLYKQNENYRIIANCMEHPEFRKLFDQHFSTWDNVKNILMFLKLYQEIEKSSDIELNGYHKLSILDSIMKNQKLRNEICNQVIQRTQYVNLLD